MASHLDRTPLFGPVTLGKVHIRDRVVMTGQGTGLAENFLPSERHVDQHRERAMGGVGLIGMAFPQIPTSQDVPGEPHARRRSEMCSRPEAHR